MEFCENGNKKKENIQFVIKTYYKVVVIKRICYSHK